MWALKVIVAAAIVVGSGAFLGTSYKAIAVVNNSSTNTSTLRMPTPQPIDSQILVAVRSLSKQVKDQASKIEQLHSQVAALQKQLKDQLSSLHQLSSLQEQLKSDTKQINGRLMATCIASVDTNVEVYNIPNIINNLHTALQYGVPSNGTEGQTFATCTRSAAWRYYYYGADGRLFTPFR